MKILECGHQGYDLTHGKGEHRNYICYTCNSHEWKGKFYTKKEWEVWINDLEEE